MALRVKEYLADTSIGSAADIQDILSSDLTKEIDAVTSKLSQLSDAFQKIFSASGIVSVVDVLEAIADDTWSDIIGAVSSILQLILKDLGDTVSALVSEPDTP
jgi:hypothetical protein